MSNSTDKIDSAFHQLEVRAARGAPIHLSHITQAKAKLVTIMDEVYKSGYEQGFVKGWGSPRDRRPDSLHLLSPEAQKEVIRISTLTTNKDKSEKQ